MTRKKKPVADPGKGYKPRKEIHLKTGPTDADTARAVGDLMTAPEFAAFRVINYAGPAGPVGEMLDVPALLDVLREQAAVNAGDLSRCEAMFANQATALQSLFAQLTERGMVQQTLTSFEVHMRVALRAQNQCRATLETLAAIKNPPVFTRHANIATNQQINVGAASRAGECETVQSKLLGADNGERLDTGATGAAAGRHSTLEAVAAVQRTDDGGG
jgi:hypothetical protein